MTKTELSTCVHLPKGTTILKHLQHRDCEEFIVDFEHPERLCPTCGSTSCIIKSSSYRQTVQHTSVGALPRHITFIKRRYKCKDCGVSFYERPDWLHPFLPLTNELYSSICVNLTELLSASAIAHNNHVAPAMVQRVLDTISVERPSYLPETLCIDEFKGDAGSYLPKSRRWTHIKFQCNIVDGDTGASLDILPNRTASYLISYFNSFNSSMKSSVKFVCCDMNNGYPNTVRKCFPNAILCVDMFHVIQELNRVMDRVRSDLQKEARLTAPDNSDYKVLKDLSLTLKTKASNQDTYWKSRKSSKLDRLEAAFQLYPDLKEAYTALQDFHTICEESLLGIRKVKLTDWIRTYTSSNIPDLRTAANTINKWRPYIENSWRYGKSNAPCEGVNNTIKAFKRQSFGVHSFDNFRKRILLICGNTHVVYSRSSTNPNRKHRDGAGGGESI